MKVSGRLTLDDHKDRENCGSSAIPRADGGNCKYFRKTRIDSVTGKSFTLIAEGKEKAGTLSCIIALKNSILIMQNLVRCCTSVIMERVKRHLSPCALEYSQFPHKMNLAAYGGWTITLQLKRLYQLITFPSHSLQPKMIVLLTSYGSLT